LQQQTLGSWDFAAACSAIFGEKAAAKTDAKDPAKPAVQYIYILLS
jgi:hypothetical protein